MIKISIIFWNHWIIVSAIYCRIIFDMTVLNKILQEIILCNILFVNCLKTVEILELYRKRLTWYRIAFTECARILHSLDYNYFAIFVYLPFSAQFHMHRRTDFVILGLFGRILLKFSLYKTSKEKNRRIDKEKYEN